MYVLIIIIASLTGEPAKLHTYTTDTLEQCQLEENDIKRNYDNPAEVIIQMACYKKGDFQ
jgi:hypothetical protein